MNKQLKSIAICAFIYLSSCVAIAEHNNVDPQIKIIDGISEFIKIPENKLYSTFCELEYERINDIKEVPMDRIEKCYSAIAVIIQKLVSLHREQQYKEQIEPISEELIFNINTALQGNSASLTVNDSPNTNDNSNIKKTLEYIHELSKTMVDTKEHIRDAVKYREQTNTHMSFEADFFDLKAIKEYQEFSKETYKITQEEVFVTIPCLDLDSHSGPIEITNIIMYLADNTKKDQTHIAHKNKCEIYKMNNGYSVGKPVKNEDDRYWTIFHRLGLQPEPLRNANILEIFNIMQYKFLSLKIMPLRPHFIRSYMKHAIRNYNHQLFNFTWEDNWEKDENIIRFGRLICFTQPFTDRNTRTSIILINYLRLVYGLKPYVSATIPSIRDYSSNELKLTMEISNYKNMN